MLETKSANSGAYSRSEREVLRDGVYHCDDRYCPFRASFYCMMTCRGAWKRSGNSKS